MIVFNSAAEYFLAAGIQQTGIPALATQDKEVRPGPWVWLFFPLRPVDLRSASCESFFLGCPEVGQTEPPPALAFSSVGRVVSAGQLSSGQPRKKTSARNQPEVN